MNTTSTDRLTRDIAARGAVSSSREARRRLWLRIQLAAGPFLSGFDAGLYEWTP